jgi:hypothetical protein
MQDLNKAIRKLALFFTFILTLAGATCWTKTACCPFMDALSKRLNLNPAKADKFLNKKRRLIKKYHRDCMNDVRARTRKGAVSLGLYDGKRPVDDGEEDFDEKLAAWTKANMELVNGISRADEGVR